MDNLIDDYVVDYLKSLKEVAQDIIFVSDCEIDQNEQKKLDGIVQKSICKKHGEYDFGSYKIGLFAVKEELKNYDQLIMANDSCYLISSLVPVFEEMKNREIKGFDFDFWGMIQSIQGGFPIHVQSYFLVFNQNVFLNKEFFDFFSFVKKENSKIDIIRNYEVGLSTFLLGLGFKKEAFIQKIFEQSPGYVLIPNLLSKGFPFIKVEMLQKNLLNLDPKQISKWKKFANKDCCQVVENHIKRCEDSEKKLNSIKNNRSILNLLVDGAKSENDEQTKIQLLSNAASFASNQICGKFNSKKIEDELLKISQKHILETNQEPKTNSFLHVFTECYVTGGHTRVCERWIKYSSDEEIHSVVLINQQSEIPEFLKEVVNQKSGEFIIQQRGNSYLKKALDLRELASKYEKIILHVHMNDIVPIIAFGTNKFKRPIIFFNHADHLFWLGVSISDQVVNLRNFAKDFNIRYRDTKNNFVIPLPIDEAHKIKDENKIDKTKLELGFKESSKIVLTIASSWKFRPFGKYNFAEMAIELVSKDKDISVLAIGPNLNEEFWNSAFKNSGGRIKAIGNIPNDEVEKYLSIADMAIDSFPISSFTALLDVAKYGVPCLSIKTPLNEMEAFRESKIYCNNQKDLVEKTLRIIKEKNQSDLLNFLSNHHFKDPFKKNLQKLYEATPLEHTIHDFRDDDNRELTTLELFLASSELFFLKQKKTFFKKIKNSCKKRVVSIKKIPLKFGNSCQKRIAAAKNYLKK
jgi:hypothetical protein